MPRPTLHFAPADGRSSLPLPGLRPGVVLFGEGESAELRDLKLGQVVRLGTVAGAVVGLLDGTRDAEQLLKDAGRVLGDNLNPLGLVELLQALDRRALLDTPRARMVVAEGAVRADIAALQKLGRRTKPIQQYRAGTPGQHEGALVDAAVGPGSSFACRSCARCCSDQQMLGPIPRAERDVILEGFAKLGNTRASDPSNFVPLPTGETPPLYLLRARQGYCVYLSPQGSCRVQDELGEAAKPSHCRMYPFRAVKTPEGWDVGLSLSCPTVAHGGGPSAQAEATRTLRSLPVLHPSVLQVPSVVPAASDRLLPFARYHRWEREALARISDTTVDPKIAWLATIDSFAQILAESAGDELDLDTGDVEFSEDDEVAPSTAATVSPAGVGDRCEDALDNLDVALRDLALWAELLAGLEPADPAAIRRFRHAVLRMRAEVAIDDDAAPALAEVARLRARVAPVDAFGEVATSMHRLPQWRRPRCRPAGRNSQSGSETSTGEISTDPGFDTERELPARGTDHAVQRRFLVQFLMEKRAFEFGAVNRGLFAATVMLAALRNAEVPGDEEHLNVEDVVFLTQHAAFTDVIDTRASVRAVAGDPSIHRALLDRTPVDLNVGLRVDAWALDETIIPG